MKFQSALRAKTEKPGPLHWKEELSQRAYYRQTTSEVWEPIWEAGPYYERLQECLGKAYSYAIFVGWQLDSRIELSTSRHESFREFLVRLCAEKPDFHIYFLVWDYAYFYVFEREILQSWVWEGLHERLHFVFDNRHPLGGSHHEKFVIIDGETAFVGGVDICDDRWDSPQHFYSDSRRSLDHEKEEHRPYHDMTVEVRGEVAVDLVEYIGARWRAISSIPFPERPRMARLEGAGKYRLLISRTRASVDLRRPLLVRESEFLIHDLIRSVRHQLVIENQYYWSPQINDELSTLMRARAGTGLKILLVVPAPLNGSTAFRMMGVLQTALLERLEKVAKETRTLFVAGCPYALAPDLSDEKSIYVHSKVAIVDDRYMAIGSANLNNRAFRLDTELNLTLVGETEETRLRIARLAKRIVAHWGQKTFSLFYPEETIHVREFRTEPHVYLKHFREAWLPYFRTFEAWLAKHLPIGRLFDPNVPWAFFLKARLSVERSKRMRRALPFLTWGALLFTHGLAFVALGSAMKALGPTFQPQPLAWAVLYILFLSASWLVPLPVGLGVIAAGLQFGPRAGGLTSFFALFSSALAGYTFARIFPTVARVFYRKASSERLHRTFGLRNFWLLLLVMADPRIGFQSKIGYQGVFSFPVRWFLASGVWLSSLYAGLSYLSGIVSETLGFNGGIGFFVFYIVATVGVGVFRLR
ncbi:MAG: phospholipase D-like domain-containing protein [Bdellovibrionota bacterium]